MRTGVRRAIGAASNLRSGQNPPYTIADFRTLYPQFTAELVPDIFIEAYLELAGASLEEARYHKAWRIAMSLFIAHFATLYLQSLTPEGADAQEVMAAGQLRGLDAGQSADGVSYSVDYSSYKLEDLEGWAQWKLTVYGLQFASLAKLYGKGGMYVW